MFVYWDSMRTVIHKQIKNHLVEVRSMSVHQSQVSPRAVKLFAAIIMGLSIGGLLPPDPTLLQSLGTAPGVLVGAMGVVGGGLIYTQVPRQLSSSGCGCGESCDCH